MGKVDRKRVARTIYGIVGAAALISFTVVFTLLGQLETTTRAYDGLISGLVGQQEQAREMQVAFKVQVQAWKDILLHGARPAERNRYTEEFMQREAEVRAMGTALSGELTVAPVRDYIERFLVDHDALGHRYREALEVYARENGRDLETADAMVRGIDGAPNDDIDSAVAILWGEVQRNQWEQHEANTSRWRRTLALTAGFALLLIVLAVALARQVQGMLGAMEEAVAAAKEASRAKSQFLANMSHELRTPLNAILGFSELLEEELPGPLRPEQKEYLGHVLKSGRHLLALISDLLDLAKTEAGRMTIQLEKTSLTRCVEDVRPGIQTLSDSAGVEVTYDLPDDLPELSADPLRLRQVLYNLLSNAVKFTPKGGFVKVRARSVVPWVEVEVADTGVGVPPEALPRLFGEFEQVQQDGSRPEGTGLGLALSKHLIEAHGGHISFSSELGVGSTVRFRLPAGVVTG